MAKDATIDASLLLTLGDAAALHLAWSNARYRWHITPIVRSEVKSEPTRSEISNALLAGRLTPTELDTTADAELKEFAFWSRVVDAGEAEAIAVALSRRWVVGIEDLFAQRKLVQLHGPAVWINSATLLLNAVDDGRVSAAEGDRILKNLDCYAGYAKRGISTLADLRISD